MGKIRVYQSRTEVPTARARTGLVQPTFTAADFPSIEGIKQIGQTMLNVQKQEDAKTRLDMRSAIAQERIEIAKKIAQMEQSAELGAPGHVEASEALVGQSLARLTEKYGDRFAPEVKANFADVQASTVSSAMRFQSAQSGAKMAHDIKNVTDSNIEAILQDPKTGMPVAMQDIDKTQASLLASGLYDPKVVAEAMDAERARAWDTYTSSLISSAGSDQELDAIQEDLGQKGGMMSEGMSPKGVAEAQDFIKRRRKQIKVEAHNSNVEEAEAALKPVKTGFYADIEADTPAAKARIASGHWSQKALEVFTKYDYGENFLSRTSTAARTARRAALREIKFEKADAQKYAEIEVKFKTYDGGYTVDQLKSMGESGELTPAGLNAALSARRTYDNMIKARDAGQVKEAARLQKQLDKEKAKLAKDQARLDDKNKIVDISLGLEKDPEAAIAAMTPEMRPQARKAAAAWAAKDEKEKAREQSREVKLRAELLERGILKGDFATSDDAHGAIDDYEEEYKGTSAYASAVSAANSLRRATKGINVDGRYVNGVVASIALAQTSYAGTGRATVFMPDEMPKKERELWDQGFRQDEMAWAEDMQAIGGEPPSPQETQAFRENRARSTSWLPDYIVHDMRRSLRGGDDQAAVSAAIGILRWQAVNPNFGKRFDEGGDFERAVRIANHIKNDLPPKEALNALKDEEAMTPNRKAEIEDLWKLANQSKGRGFDINHHVSAAKDLDSLTPADEDFLDAVDDDTAAAAAFNALVKSSFDRHGSIDVAREYAVKVMRHTWGVTRVGGEARLVRNPVELHHGVSALSDKQNVSWIRGDFQKAISQKVGHQVDMDRVLILADPALTNGSKPTYQAYYQGRLVFRGGIPDAADSPEATNNIAIKRAVSKAGAAKKKAETLREQEEMRAREERGERTTGPGAGPGIGDPFGTRRQSIRRPKMPGFTGAPFIDETGS
jgi:hypothetical protein